MTSQGTLVADILLRLNLDSDREAVLLRFRKSSFSQFKL